MTRTQSHDRRPLTNVDRERLARSDAVHAFMLRVVEQYRDPVTGAVLSRSLAEAAANAFGLVGDDGFSVPAGLYGVAERVALARIGRF